MKIIKLGLILFLVSAVSGTSLSLVYVKTKERIAQVKEEKIYRLQKEILPDAESFEEINEGAVKIGYDENRNEIGRIISTAPKGYASNIEMLVGINNEGKITVIKIVKQSETPGLGSQVTKKEFLGQFILKGIEEMVLRKDSSDAGIDSVTGATISSRAVLKGAREALVKYRSLQVVSEDNAVSKTR